MKTIEQRTNEALSNLAEAKESLNKAIEESLKAIETCNKIAGELQAINQLLSNEN